MSTGRSSPGQKSRRPPRTPELWLPVARDVAAYRLATRRATTRTGSQLLIPRADGEPWREYDYRNWRRRVFRPAMRHAGLPISRPYDLRHACASLMIHAGKPLTEIAEHLGNSVATISEHYAHLIADMRGQTPTSVPDAIMSARSNRKRQRADLNRTRGRRRQQNWGRSGGVRGVLCRLRGSCRVP